MHTSRDSSPAVISQIGSDDGKLDQHADHQSISQAQFATQLPTTDTQYLHQNDQTPALLSQQKRSAQISDRTEPSSTEGNLQALFPSRAQGRKSTAELALDTPVTQQSPPSNSAVIAPVCVVSGVEDVEDDNLTQQELVVPMSSPGPALANAAQQPEDPGESRHDSSVSSIIQEYGLEVGLNGRLSTQMCLVPKDQALLLDSNDKWYPSLVGSSAPKPTVPLSLLNYLSAQADQPELETTFTQQTEAPIEPRTPPKANKLKHPSSGHTSETSDGSDNETEGIEWDPSPDRLKGPDLLPPDSPSETRVQQIHHDLLLTKQGDKVIPQQNIPDLPSDEIDIEKGSTTVSIQGSFKVPGPPNSSREKSVAEHTPKPSSLMVATGNGAISESRSSSDPAGNSDQKRTSFKNVQVYRTPYTSKQGSSPKIQYTSMSLVPGTFDDAQSQDKDVIRYDETNQKSFEDNSSEDEIRNPARKDQPLIIPTASHHKASEKSNSSNSQASANNGIFTSRGGSKSHKRDLSASVAIDEVEVKRQRVSKDSEVEMRQASPVYRQLDAERRSERREVLGRLARKSDIEMTTRSLSSSEGLDTASVKNSVPVHQSSKSRAVVNGKQSHKQDSSVSPSLHPSSKPKSTSNAPLYTMQSSMSKPQRPADLYSTFKAVYGTYKGEEKDFDASCRLLRDVRAQTSLHPSLWDAFVFRHYHDYRAYLHVVIEEAGTAISYSDFFDNIFDPGYTERVITPLTLEAEYRSAPMKLLSSYRASSLYRDDSADEKRSFSDHHPSIHQRVTAAKPRSTFVQATAEEEVDEEPHNSQRYTHSVQAWLERARGASSPILGTPELVKIDKHHENDVPDLEVLDPPRPADKEYHEVDPAQTSNKTTKSNFNVSAGANAKDSHTIRSHQQIQQKFTTETKRIKISKPPPKHQKPERSSAKREMLIDTVFKQFARDFDNLHSERANHAYVDAHEHTQSQQTFVDVFRWRR